MYFIYLSKFGALSFDGKSLLVRMGLEAVGGGGRRWEAMAAELRSLAWRPEQEASEHRLEPEPRRSHRSSATLAMPASVTNRALRSRTWASNLLGAACK